MKSPSPYLSEGEYISTDSEAKATRPPHSRKNHKIDGPSRHYSSGRARRYSRSRSRSPYRAPRGEKRRREQDRNDGSRIDVRASGIRYEDERHSYRNDRHESRQAKRSRTHSPSRSRSRSPYRTSRNTAQNTTARSSSKLSVTDQAQHRNGGIEKQDTKRSHQTTKDTTTSQSLNELPEPIQSDKDTAEAILIEARRKRREAIKNKFKSQEPSLLVQALHVGSDTATLTRDFTPTRSVSPVPITSPAPGTPRSIASGRRSVSDDSVTNDEDIFAGERDTPGGGDEPSAADYDPTIDMQEERARHDKRLFKEDELSTEKADKQVLEQTSVIQLPADDKPELDMFAEDDDDMFAEAPPDRPSNIERVAKTLDAAMLDNWDDAEGYYLTILGELIDGRYKVTQNLGRGMFASVVRAIDTKTDEQPVAIKIIRNNESMRKAGIKEVDILQNLSANDPDDKMHLVRLLRSFDHKSHLCIVFENLSMNLREVLKKYGRDVGISLKSIRAYSQQLFRSLSLLKKCQLLHADLKPDNILVNESRSVVKVADLGSASPITENVTAPYLVSRFYRAPEVILGIPYDYGIDMWSIGCTLFELYTGKILFTGRNNNNMLRTIMECRGRFPNKLLRRGSLTYDYFDDLLNFKAMEPDKLTGKMVVKTVDIKAKPIRDLKSRMLPRGKKVDETERAEIELFIDLLDKCLALSPEKRITPTDALRHAFITRAK